MYTSSLWFLGVVFKTNPPVVQQAILSEFYVLFFVLEMFRETVFSVARTFSQVAIVVVSGCRYPNL